MWEGKARAEWDHTSWTIAKLHNVNCAKESDLITPDEINPLRRHEQKTWTFAELKRELKIKDS